METNLVKTTRMGTNLVKSKLTMRVRFLLCPVVWPLFVSENSYILDTFVSWIRIRHPPANSRSESSPIMQIRIPIIDLSKL